MRINQLSLSNIRVFHRLEIAFDPQVTVIVGKNGSGKTTILKALSTALLAIIHQWPDPDRQFGGPTEISADDIRLGSKEAEIWLGFSVDGVEDEKLKPVVLRQNGWVPPPETPLPYFTMYDVGIQALSLDYAPLVVYYRQDRGFDNSAFMPEQSRGDTLLRSITGAQNPIINLEQWWNVRDADEARTVRDDDNPSFRDPQLEAIRQLVKQIDGFERILYQGSAAPSGLYFKKSDGAVVHINQLSSGERSYIILLADLARRLSIISPNQNLNDIRGVVLIDEIELNLHPAWQSKIIGTMRRVFAKCQFIVTTHSPQVLTMLEAEHIRILRNEGDGLFYADTPLNTKGRSSNYLLEGIFGATERAPEVETAIFDFNDAVQRRDSDEARRLFTEIEKGIEGDAPELAIYRTRLKRLETSL